MLLMLEIYHAATIFMISDAQAARAQRAAARRRERARVV